MVLRRQRSTTLPPSSSFQNLESTRASIDPNSFEARPPSYIPSTNTKPLPTPTVPQIRDSNPTGNNNIYSSLSSSNSPIPSFKPTPPPIPMKNNTNSLPVTNNGIIPPKHASVYGKSADSWDIQYSDITTFAEVGRGAFGIVYKGKWREIPVGN